MPAYPTGEDEDMDAWSALLVMYTQISPLMWWLFILFILLFTASAFVEFDGPQAVERAIELAGDTKIGGKKIHLSKFEIRTKKEKKNKNEGDSTADADSEDSSN